ncbi:multidrug ABC transporter permease [Rubrobacter xylanophilus]|uniref:Multidrug ABC transporter permease n=1 Tax=Rubrobacter xylanophilus TaxID=49319 RepID=A0A510HJL0_9ACTN|nr:lantibiotic immunity ABC transporter MutE/EpiE family permease subunit [Rubrobacter xylanophilus]BBL79455.1 multidrug ABC transporter permease [Rubrobacter xylanophilus]
MTLVRAFDSERIKYRRTFTHWLVALGPVGLVLSYAMVGLLGESETTWPLFLGVVYNWWPILWVPMGAALLAALAAWYEKRAGAWVLLRARPQPPAVLFGAKLLVLALHTLLSTAILAATVAVVGAVVIGAPIPLDTLLLGAFLPWIAALPILVIQLWVATAGGFGASVVVGVVGFISGALTAESSDLVHFVPWAWPIRVVIPIIGIHANGVPLGSGDPLWDSSIVPVILGLALIVAAALLAAGSLWFSRKEVR